MDDLLQGNKTRLSLPLPFFDHGDIDFDETEARLGSKPPGTFLFRNSQTIGYFVVALQTGSTNASVKQSKIERIRGNGFVYNGNYYEPTNIGDLVYQNSNVLIAPLPAPAAQVMIYDKLSPSKTVELLSSQPVGTYLLRTSKSIALPGALTLAYNAGADGVIQTLLEPADGGGYTMEDAAHRTLKRYYLNIDAVVSAYKHILLHPYSSPITGPTKGGRRSRTASSSWMRLVRHVHTSRVAQDSDALYKDSLVQASKLYRAGAGQPTRKTKTPAPSLW
jgi:hypothetical protein